MVDQAVYARRRMVNLLQSAIIMAGLAVVLLLMAWFFAGLPGVVMVCVVALPALAFGGRHAPVLVLKMYRAVPVERIQAPALGDLLEKLAISAGMSEPPLLYYIPSRAALAFSVGLGNSGAIALSDGMLRLLTWRELVGVVAHEVCHIASHDTRVMGIADLASRIAAAISLAGQLLIFINLPAYLFSDHALPWFPLFIMAAVPYVMTILQLALSRSREYEADLAAVGLTGDAEGLAAALDRIEQNEMPLVRRLFVPGGGIEVPSVLRTHPATAERIKRLLELSGKSSGSKGSDTVIAHDQYGRPVIVDVEPPRKAPRRRIGGFWY